MKYGEKVRPFFITMSAIAGVSPGIHTDFGDWSPSLIEPFLMAMLFFVSFPWTSRCWLPRPSRQASRKLLSVDVKMLEESFLNVKFTSSALIINFVWTPIFAVVLGMASFSDSIDVQIRMLMLMVTLCTDWYLAFTASSKENVPLSSSVPPPNLVSQIPLLPVYLFLFVVERADFEPVSMLTGVVVTPLVPILLSVLLKQLASKVKGRKSRRGVHREKR